MLTPVAQGVLVHRSELLRNNTVVVEGRRGVLVADPGITGDELACLAADLRALGRPVVAGFATHPDWDHALWHPALGDAPRFGTAACAAALAGLLADPGWRARLAEAMPPEIAGEVPLDAFGLVTGLPGDGATVPWDGPRVRVLAHPAHAAGHAALLVEGARVLVAGDMVSDVLVPFPDLGAADPVGDYLAGLRTLEAVVDEVDVVVPGHGSVGDAGDLRARLALDRAYVEALAEGRLADDPRIGPAATYGADWLPDVAAWQQRTLAARGIGSPS